MPNIQSNDDLRRIRNWVLSFALLVIASVGGCMFGYPHYQVYAQRLEGEAELAKAEYSKQVQIKDAEAKTAAAHQFADAEVIRAGGVAQANKIIGDSLKGNDAYLRYLWINKLSESESKGGQVIYIPTEAGLPILEANRFSKPKE